jgi:heat shock protein HslJ
MRPRVTMPRWPAWVMGAAAAACAYPAVTIPAPAAPEHEARQPKITPAETVDTDPASLAGTRWVLREIEAQQVPDAPPVTLAFEAARFGGHSGCNGYGGEYRIEGRRIVVGLVSSTLVGCGGAVGDVEQRFYRGIAGAFEVAHRRGHSLAILRDGRPVLLFAPSR